MPLVQSSSLARLPLPVFQQVVKNILTQLGTIGLQDPALTTAMTDLQTAYATLDGVLKQAQGSVHTQQLLDLDAQRDAVVRGLSIVLRGYTYCPNPAKEHAARVLLHYLKAYGSGIANQSQIAQTAAISNLLQDFGKPDAVAAQQQIALTDWVGPLQSVNAQFESLYSVRAADLDVPEVGLAKKARAETQQRFDVFVTRLNALLTLATTPDSGQEQAAAMINTEVKTAKTNEKKGSKKE